MNTKDIMWLVVAILGALVVYSLLGSKLILTKMAGMETRINKMEDSMNTVVNHTQTTKLAMACVLEKSEPTKPVDENRSRIGFKLNQGNNVS